MLERVQSRAAATGDRHGVIGLLRWLLAVESVMYSVLTPMLPHFERVLGATKPQLGVLYAAYTAALIPGSLLGGWLSVRFGVRRTTLVGILTFAVSAPAFGFVHRLWALDAIRAVQGLGCGLVWVGGLAWIAAAAPVRRRGEILGTAMGTAILGLLIGPLVGVAAVKLSTEIVFSLLGVTALLAGLVPAKSTEPVRHDPERSAPLRKLLASRAARLALWLALVESIAFGAIVVLLPLRLARFGATTAEVGGVFMLSCLVSMYISRASGRLSDRRGMLVPCAAGLLGSAALLALLPLLHSALTLSLASIVLMGAPLTAFLIPSLALLTDAAQATGIALALSTMLFNLAFALGETVGAPGAAALAQASSDAVPLLGMAALMLVMLGVVLARAGVLRAAPGHAQANAASVGLRSAAPTAAAYADEIAE